MPISEPNVTLQIIPAAQLAGVTEQKVLLVGQMLSGGTATAGYLLQEFPNDGTEDALFGKRSHIAGMVRNFKRENKISRVDVLPLDDAGGATQATAIITVTNAATEAGSIDISIGSEKDHTVTVDIADLDAATDIGDAIVTALTANLTMPAQAANVAGVVTVTAENGGTLANSWSVKVSGSVAGVSIALTGWTGGTTDPTLTGILDPIANIRYQTVVWPGGYALDVIEDELNTRFNASNSVMDGVAVQVKVDTLANLKTYTSPLNSQSLVIAGQKVVDTATLKGSATVEMPDTAASQIAAIRALRLTEGASLTRYLTTVSPKDQFGGVSIASLPYFNTLLPYMTVADPVDEFTATDLDELRDNAVAAYGPNRAYNATIMGEFVTTYLTDIAGNPDDSYKFLNTIDTASVIREFFFANMKARYAQTRLTDGDLVAGRDMANASSVRAFCNELYDRLAEDALTQRGTAAKKDYNDNLSIDIDVRNGKVTIDQAPLLVSQVRTILGTIQINFGG